MSNNLKLNKYTLRTTSTVLNTPSYIEHRSEKRRDEKLRYLGDILLPKLKCSANLAEIPAYSGEGKWVTMGSIYRVSQKAVSGFAKIMNQSE